MRPIPLTPNRGLDEVEYKILRIGLLLLQLGPGLCKHLIDRHHTLLPPIRPGSLLAHRSQLLQRRCRILHVHGTVLRLLRVHQDAGNGLGDGWEGCSAENAVATVKQADALSFDAHDEADHHAPVEERARADEGVSHATGGRFFLEGVLDGNFVFVNRQLTGLLVQGVGPELGRDEVPDMGFGGCFNQEELCGDGNRGEGRDEGFLALQSGGEGVKGVIVDRDDSDGGGKAVSAALASQDGHFEAGLEKMVEDGWAEVAGGLRESVLSALSEGCSRRNGTPGRGSYPSQSDVSDAAHVVASFRTFLMEGEDKMRGIDEPSRAISVESM